MYMVLDMLFFKHGKGIKCETLETKFRDDDIRFCPLTNLVTFPFILLVPFKQEVLMLTYFNKTQRAKRFYMKYCQIPLYL